MGKKDPYNRDSVSKKLCLFTQDDEKTVYPHPRYEIGIKKKELEQFQLSWRDFMRFC